MKCVWPLVNADVADCRLRFFSGLLRLVVLATCVALGCGQGSGQHGSDLGNRAGDGVRSAEPEVASCVIDREKDGTREPLCLGVLIRRDLVLTAAHCMFVVAARVRCPSSADPRWVDAAEARITSDFPGLDVDFGWVGRWNPSDGRDLALLRLAEPLRVTEFGSTDFGTAGDGEYRTFRRALAGSVVAPALSSPFLLHRRDETNGYWVGTDTLTLERGDSGGGLFDAKTGRVIGVNSKSRVGSRCPDSGGTGEPCTVFAALAGSEQWFAEALASLTTRRNVPPPSGAHRGFIFDECAQIAEEEECLATQGCGFCVDGCLAGAVAGPRIPYRDTILEDVCPPGQWKY